MAEPELNGVCRAGHVGGGGRRGYGGSGCGGCGILMVVVAGPIEVGVVFVLGIAALVARGSSAVIIVDIVVSLVVTVVLTALAAAAEVK